MLKKKIKDNKIPIMSCLFDSLSFFITELDGKELRKEISKYIAEDPVLIEPNTKLSTILQYEDKSLQDYVDEMSKDSTWGGGIEIKAFCEMFKIRVFVHVLRDSKIIKFYPSQNNFEKKYIEIFWNGYHFSNHK